MKRLYTYIIGMCLMLAAASCDHKELCYHHSHTARVTLLADWSKFYQETPTGMTLMVYPQSGDKAVKHLTNTIEQVTTSLPVGRYHSFVFNQSETEYASLSFRGMEKYETAEVYANASKAKWYQTKAEGERVVMAPTRWIATDRFENAEVTQQMVDATGEETFSRTQQQDATGFVIAEHTPQNIIYTITVTVYVKGFQNLRSARASLDGLAEGYFLGTGKYSNSTVTQLIEDWEKKADDTDRTKGVITASFTCFGLPDKHTATPDENLFSLSFLLVDNQTVKDYTFKVGDRFVYEYDTEGDVNVRIGLRLMLELELDEALPDVIPEGSSGMGFDATLEDWGEWQEIPVL